MKDRENEEKGIKMKRRYGREKDCIREREGGIEREKERQVRRE